jgi:glycine/D-amino acid oxidase-like deaminating enzyme
MQLIKTIVIGAGVMGASVAYRLAQAGSAVTVLEATRIGGGTSGVSFAWTNAHEKPPKTYHDLNVAGMKAHAALADEFGATPWWHGGGSLEWVAEPDRAAQRENVEQLRSWGYAAEWITLGQLEELEPDTDPATIGDAPVAFFPEEGWLDPVVYAHAMLSAAQFRHGAKVICGTRVVDLIVAGDRVTGVRVADGTQYGADIVVNCAGRWTNEATRDAGLHLPLAPTVGFLVFTPPVAASLSRVVRTTVIDARPDGAGTSDAALEPDRRDIELRREAQSRDAGGARSGAARPTAVAIDRRGRAGGGAPRDPADPRRPTVCHRTDAANFRLLHRYHP